MRSQQLFDIIFPPPTTLTTTLFLPARSLLFTSSPDTLVTMTCETHLLGAQWPEKVQSDNLVTTGKLSTLCSKQLEDLVGVPMATLMGKLFWQWRRHKS